MSTFNIINKSEPALKLPGAQ